MVPTVSQQVSGMRAAMAKAVLPAIDPTDAFAQEQAGLILATLDWILDVHESEYLYVASECREGRQLLTALDAPSVGLNDAALDAEIKAALSGEDGDLAPLATLRERATTFKDLADRAFRLLVAEGHPEEATRARELMGAAATAQRRREQAWFRMTGFTVASEGGIADVLEAQR